VERQERLELQRCLARLADGDRAAFRPVFDLAWPRVRQLAARLLPHGADADDAAQLALVKVFERAGEYDRTRDALAWIVAIAGWECLTVRRKTARRREAAGEVLAALADGAPSAEEQLLGAELEAAAVAVLGQLRLEDRTTLRVALFGEGERTVKPATFRKRMERALERLRAAWRDHGIG
jgi:DNA-directed RNA polymerase specialized sigma24 family protein